MKFAISRNESLIYCCPRLIEKNAKYRLCDLGVLAMWSVKEKKSRDFMEQRPSVSSMRLILKIRSICDKQTVVINVCL